MKNILSIIMIAASAAAMEPLSAQTASAKSADENHNISFFLQPTIGDYIIATPSKQSIMRNFMMNQPIETETKYHHDMMLGIMVGFTICKARDDSTFRFSLGYFAEEGQRDTLGASFSGCFASVAFPSKIIQWGALLRVGKYDNGPRLTISPGPWIGYEFKRNFRRYGHFDPRLELILSGNGLMDNFEPEFMVRISLGFR